MIRIRVVYYLLLLILYNHVRVLSHEVTTDSFVRRLRIHVDTDFSLIASFPLLDHILKLLQLSVFLFFLLLFFQFIQDFLFFLHLVSFGGNFDVVFTVKAIVVRSLILFLKVVVDTIIKIGVVVDFILLVDISYPRTKFNNPPIHDELLNTFRQAFMSILSLVQITFGTVKWRQDNRLGLLILQDRVIR